MTPRWVLLSIVSAVACGAADDATPMADDDGGSICTFAQTCNPIYQTGCGEGERCTYHLDASGVPIEQELCDGRGASRVCVPEGSLAIGATCAINPGSFDDCVAGAVCLGGVCRRYCTVAPDSCDLANGEDCVALAPQVVSEGGCVPAAVDAGVR